MLERAHSLIGGLSLAKPNPKCRSQKPEFTIHSGASIRMIRSKSTGTEGPGSSIFVDHIHMDEDTVIGSSTTTGEPIADTERIEERAATTAAPVRASK